MGENNYSLSDIKSVIGESAEGMGGGLLWIIVLFILLFGFNGGGFSQNKSDAVTNEILSNQHFNALDARITNLGNGICDSTFALNNTILTEGRAMQTQLAQCYYETNRNVDSVRFDNAQNTQKILDAICGNRIADMQNQINQLQLQAAMCGVVRYPNVMAYNAGASPFCGCNPCGCANI